MIGVYNLKDKKVELDANRYYFLIHPDFKDRALEIMKITPPRILGRDVSTRIKELGELDARWVNPEKVYVEDATFYKERIKMRKKN